jgi:hypothetical protein
MKRVVAYAFTALLAGAVCPASFAVPLNGAFGYTVDENGGYGVDADLGIDATEHLSLSAGAGHSKGSAESGDLSGTLLSAAASLHGARGGFSLGYDHFDDSSNYRAGTLAARAWIAAGDFELALLGRRRDMDVELTLQLPLRLLRRDVSFSANGFGLQVSYGNETFSAYAMALEYDYDREFEDFVGLIDSPQLEDRPRVEALVSSFISQAQGTIDRQAGVGGEYGFGRHSVALDLAYVHDAVLGAGSTSVALTYRNARSARVDWGVTGGVSDSDAFGQIAFLGISIGLAN